MNIDYAYEDIYDDGDLVLCLVCDDNNSSTDSNINTVEGMNFASKKIETMLHSGLDFCIFLHIFTYYYIFLSAFLYLFYFFDVKLIANKPGGAGGATIHYPINFT